MKKTLLIIVAILAFAFQMSAADTQPLEFVETNHDFGTIKASNGPVSYEYEFKNTTSEPVVIIMVTNGGCGCTKPSYPRKPIKPGATGTVKVTFDPTGRQGEFNREVKVRYQAEKKKLKASLTFSGAIVP